MLIATDRYRLELDDRSGALVSLTDGRRELLHRGPTPIPLFSLRLRTPDGTPIDVTASDATTVEIERRDGPDGVTVDLHYARLADQPLDVHVRVVAPRAGHPTSWHLSLEHDTDDVVEWVRFPDLAVPDDLIGTGGEARLLWPAMEGVLVEDAALRERTWLRYEGVEYPSKGWEGFYPGACAAQFMAYCAPGGGLYLGAHDPQSIPKAVEYYPWEGGIRLELRAYPGAVARGAWALEYDVALGVFAGDWHDAARIYRDWYDTAPMPTPPRLAEAEAASDPARPAWLADPPVVAIYPVRGEKDTGDMTPNEYFPYARALPALDRLAATLDSPVMALLMHWEGTAPWAPPYVWPPFGGAAMFEEFVEGAHAHGHLVGVYCSGIGWTQESLLVPYDRRAQFDHAGLRDAMCLAPDGELPYSRICAGAQRWGYDLCAATPAAVGVAVGEVAKIAAAGVDYIQYFDQNIGGTPYFCYARDHGRPPAPGSWQVAAMSRLHDPLAATLGALPRPPMLGCEAAAEPYQRRLPFNDLRYHMALVMGRPVPLYAYLYHERIANFMGNGVVVGAEGQPPDERVLRARFAYSFIAGDVPAVVLKGGARCTGAGACHGTCPRRIRSGSRA